MHNEFYRGNCRNSELCSWCTLTQRQKSNRKKKQQQLKMVLTLLHVHFEWTWSPTYTWMTPQKRYRNQFLASTAGNGGGFQSLHETPGGFCGPQTQWGAENRDIFSGPKTIHAQLFHLLLPTVSAASPASAASWPCIRSRAVMQPSGRLPSAGDSRLARALLLTNSPHVQVFHYNFWNKTSMLTFLDVGFGPV